jgi:pilus assembly protein Flp/PilA
MIMRTRRARLDAGLLDDAGVTSIEYALIGALIAIVIVAAVASTGTALSAFFFEVARCVQLASQGNAC